MSADVTLSAEAFGELVRRAVRAERRASTLRRHLAEIGNLSDDEIRSYVRAALALDDEKLPAASPEAPALPAAAE